MCGFVGFTGIVDRRDYILKKMADRIAHRGPDSEGYYINGECEHDSISFGFRRLSIIDLKDGSQPMFNEDGTIAIVYNGEVYNFEDLRNYLKTKGHVFRTRCDSEVLVHGYEEWGEKLAEKLRGMFSFVIWDSKNTILYGARDPFGIKPFYYYKTNNGRYIFGSEIKSFLEHPDFRPEVNPDALRPYLTLQYSSMEQTFFKNTFKLKPAHYFTLKDGVFKSQRYWSVRFSEKTDMSYDDCADQIDYRVHESVNAHRISDVKVGSFLSGGVDSSYITAVLMPNDTFSVGFSVENFDETSEAEELSKKLGVKNYIKHITAEECFDAFPTIQYHMDEPQSNPSSVPLYFLSKLASEHVTVVLSGEGADEIYAGYEWYVDDKTMEKYKKIPGFLRRTAAAVVKKLPYFKGHDFILKGSGRPENYFLGQAYIFSDKEALDVLKPEYRTGPSAFEVAKPYYDEASGLSELEKKQYLDINLWLPGDILLKADKMSMAHSLELRVPYLDKLVMEEAQKIPSEYKIAGDTKAVLRTAANKTLPDEWAHRPKKGFPVPIRNWLREDRYYNIIKNYFTSESAAIFFDTEILMKLLDDHKCNKANNQRKIWTVYTFLVWYEQFFGGSHNG